MVQPLSKPGKHRGVGAPTVQLTRFPPRRRPGTWLRANFSVMGRTLDGWNDVTERMHPPEGAFETLRWENPEILEDRLPWVWQGYLQWIRIRGRRGSDTRLAQPSLAVDKFVMMLARDPGLRGGLPHRVEQISRIPFREEEDRARLTATLHLAAADEHPCTLTPVLFDVDERTGISGGRLYRAECITDDCKAQSELGHPPEPGRTCLHDHLYAPMPAVVTGGGGS